MTSASVTARAALAACLLSLALPLTANMGDRTAAPSDDVNFVAGRRAIDAQDWPAAVEALKKCLAVDPGNADAHNWMGFAYRKQGKFDAAFAEYEEALRIDPGHKGAHEYIGEAYLMTDQPAKADAHLAELTRLCTPIPCEEHKELKRAIDEYRKKKKK